MKNWNGIVFLVLTHLVLSIEWRLLFLIRGACLFVVFHRLFRPSNTLFVLSDAFFIISWRIKFSSYDTIVVGIIYDTHGANIYIKICTTKFLSKFLKWELFMRRRYPISPPGSESWGGRDVWRYRNSHTVATWKDPIWAVSKRDARTLRSKRCVLYVTRWMWAWGMLFGNRDIPILYISAPL